MSGQISRIGIRFFLEGIGAATGEFVRFLAPRTVETLLRALPMDGRAAVWKEEVYFQTSVKMGAGETQSHGRERLHRLLAHG